MPMWGATRVPRCITGPAVCTEPGICWECFVIAREGVGKALGRKVGKDGRIPQVRSSVEQVFIEQLLLPGTVQQPLPWEGQRQMLPDLEMLQSSGRSLKECGRELGEKVVLWSLACCG